MQIPEHYTPREYQLEFFQSLADTMGFLVRFVVICWARRAGKDLTCFAYAITQMVREPMNVALIFPTKDQGFKAFWRNVENDGFRTIEHIPKELIAAQSNSKDDMMITLKNGSSFMLLGASDPEALRGANAKIYILSEFVDINSEVLNVIRPITAVNGGQIILQSTPKLDGISGGTFKRLFEEAVKNPKQFASYVDATNYLSAEQLEEVRQEYIVQNGNDFKFRQEMMLDWGQASSTSYYGEALAAMEKDGRIGMHQYDARYPVYTSWDLGMADSTAIWFWQYKDKKLRFIDAYETHDINDEAIVKFVLSKPYNFGWHFLPHDGAKRDSDAISRFNKMQGFGLVNASLLRRGNREIGINRFASLLLDENTTFHQPMTGWATEKLKIYQRKFNPLTGDYEGPDHSSESHIADAGRYTSDAIEQFFHPVTGEFLIQAQPTFTPREELVSAPLYQESTGDWAPNWDF